MNDAFAVACRRHRLLPVVMIDDAGCAPALGRALVAGGLPLIEVTLRTTAGLAAIAALARGGPADDPGLMVGAGTVVTVSQVDEAVAAGASFVVSPGYSPAVVARCLDLGVSVLPGVATAGEMMAAAGQGLTLVKFFPAAQLGGPDGLAAFAGAFPALSFVPTGGVGPQNLSEYLAVPQVAAVGGSWMVPRQALADGDFATVERRVREAVAAVDAQSRRR